MTIEKRVFLGVGHGGLDPGAVANGFKEKDVNLPIALVCQSELARHGVLTKISRSVDEYESPDDRIRECNEYAPDIAVDIHNNTGGGDGAEAYYSRFGGTGKVLAENILDEIQKIGQNSRGAKTKVNAQGADAYAFIRNTAAPAVIVECAFLDNKTDVQIVDTAAEREAMGIAIAKGMLRTLGIAYKEDAPAVKQPGTMYRVQVFAGSKRGAEEVLAKAKAAGFHDAFIKKG